MKLRNKLIIYYLIATLIALFTVGYAVLKGIGNLGIKTMENQLIEQSNLAELYISQLHLLEGEGPGISKETAKKAIGRLGLVLGNIHIYDNELNLQASSKGDSSSLIGDRENKELLAAAQKGNYSYIIKSNTVFFASPLTVEGQLTGVLKIIYPMSFLNNLILQVTRILLMGALLFSLIIAVLGVYISGRLTKPINKLTQAARSYALRIFTPVDIKSSDELSELGKSFNQMGSELQDYVRRQKQFVSNVTHELRTPLTAIKGYSELLLDELKDRPDLSKAIYHLNNESTRLEKLVEEVLTLSRIDAGNEGMDSQDVHLSGLVLETIEKMTFRGQKYGIHMVSEIEPDVHITGDHEKLVQVLINLLDNAFKFSPAGSSINIKLIKAGDMAVLSVSDEGIGISQEDRTKVFERFYRAENARGFPGTGLGLSIVKYIVESHNGMIELSPGTGGGTEAVVKLPVIK